jgi:hypothetical protein
MKPYGPSAGVSAWLQGGPRPIVLDGDRGKRLCSRRERIRADTPSRTLLIPVSNVPTYVHRARESA